MQNQPSEKKGPLNLRIEKSYGKKLGVYKRAPEHYNFIFKIIKVQLEVKGVGR